MRPLYRKMALPLCVLMLSLGCVQAKAQAQDAETPIDALHKAGERFLSGLDEEGLRAFQAIRTAHGIVRSVERVRMRIDRAVESCASAHPGMEEDLDRAFTLWKREMRPLITGGRDRIDKMILIQDFAKPADVEAYLKAFDEAAAYGDALTNAVPVTEEKACRNLLETMDGTREDLVTLLTRQLGLEDSEAAK